MACGLGAIILVFMVIKHNVDQAVLEVETEKVDLSDLQQRQESLRRQLQTVQDEAAAVSREIEVKAQQVERYRADLERLAANSAAGARARKELEAAIKSLEVDQPAAQVQTGPPQQEDYLIGLRVEGRKIAILIDSSASMTDAILIDVIRRKNGRAANKAKGPKWQRTKRIARWLMARLPKTSDVAVVSFSEEARQLGAAGWTSASNGGALDAILADLDKVVPSKSTNLHAALDVTAELKPSDIYLVTDGLPTSGDSGYKSLSPFSACSALWGGSTTISGECRIRLFRYTVDTSLLGGAKVNVVLLPLEGDPGAAREYWSWTAVTGGLLISPADSWP